MAIALSPADPQVLRLLKLQKDLVDASFSESRSLAVTSSSSGRLPREGDYFAWNGYRFEIVDMDGPRIDKILIVPAQNLPIGNALARSAD